MFIKKCVNTIACFPLISFYFASSGRILLYNSHLSLPLCKLRSDLNKLLITYNPQDVKYFSQFLNKSRFYVTNYIYIFLKISLFRKGFPLIEGRPSLLEGYQVQLFLGPHPSSNGLVLLILFILLVTKDWTVCCLQYLSFLKNINHRAESWHVYDVFTSGC